MKKVLVLIVRKVRRAHEWPNRQLIRARKELFFIMDIQENSNNLFKRFLYELI